MSFPASAMSFPTMRRGGVRSGVGLAVMRSGVRLAIVRWGGVRAGIAVIPTVISSAPGSDKPMPAPTVVITPAGPGAHAQEDAVVEIT
jgi:hypothetical protein